MIGKAVPFYVGRDLHIDCTLASTPDAQVVRAKLAEGVLNSISVVFIGQEWEQRAGVRTCIKAELLAADVVSIPSQSQARVLSVRGHYPATELSEARRALAAMNYRLMRADLAEAQRFLAELDPPSRRGTMRAQVDAQLRWAR